MCHWPRLFLQKGFGEDTKLDEIQEFFDQFGKVCAKQTLILLVLKSRIDNPSAKVDKFKDVQVLV